MSTNTLNATSAAILGILHDGPLAGGQIVKIFEERLSAFFNVTRSQVYRELPILLDSGYVKAGKVGARSRQPYTITPAGRRAFTRWLADEEPVSTRDSLRNSAALRVAFGDKQSAAQRRRLVDTATEHHTEQLAAAKEVAKVARKNGEEWPAAAAELAVGYHKAMLAWLKTLPA